MDDAAKVVLPTMQVVALVGFYGDDVAQAAGGLKSFVTSAITDRKDFDAWRDYLYYYVNHPDSAEPIVDNEQLNLLNFFFSSAYAGISDELVDIIANRGVQSFLKVLSEVDGLGQKVRSSQTLIGKSFTRAIEELTVLNAGAGRAEIREIIKESPTIKAALLLEHLGGSDALQALRNFPCVPSTCSMGPSMEHFMGELANVADLIDSNKLAGNAQADIKIVLEQLGQVIKKSSNPDKVGKPNINVIRGSVGVISILRKITDEGKFISDFEVKELITNASNGNIT